MHCRLRFTSRRNAIIAVIALLSLGCSGQKHVTEIALDGPYRLTAIEMDSWLMEPGGGSWEYHLSRKDSTGKMVVISKRSTGGWNRLFHNDSDARLYGKNLVYLERYEVPSTVPSDVAEGIPSRRIRLMAYSEKNGIVTIEKNFQDCWKATGNDQGITCYRYRDDSK